MKKESKNLLILFGIILLLSLLVAVVTLVNESSGNQGDVDTEPEETYLYLADRDPEEITEISYTYQGASPIHLIKKEKWELADDSTMPVDQTKASTLANAMATIAVQRKLADSTDNYEQYGLQTPNTQITLTYSDGSSLTFYLGNENSRLEGTQYLRTSDSSAIYLVSTNMVTFFAYDRIEILSLDEAPDITTSDLKSILITNPGTTGIQLTVSESDESGSTWTAKYGSGAVKELEDANLVGDILEAVLLLPYTDPVYCLKATDEQLQEYGLTSENATRITLTYTVTATTSGSGDSSSSSSALIEKEFTLLLGAEIPQEETESSKRFAYLMVEASGYIYRAEITDSMILLSDFSPES